MEAKFNFKKTGLSVEFTNTSTGNPVSLLWNFGDTNTSSIANPTHEYNYSGFYTVILTATYPPETPGDPDIVETYSKTIGVADVNWNPLDNPINTLILSFVPGNLDPEDILSDIPTLKSKWQLFLQPLVNPEVDINNVFEELYWPPLANFLVAQLIAYDLILTAANKYLIGIGTVSSSDSTGSAGEVKSIRTGPAEVEWFQGSETWSEVFKQGGTFTNLTQQICTLSSRLRVPLYICRKLSHSPVPPQIYKKPKTEYPNIFDKGKL